jgi:cardiolipin synthase A/B
MFLYLLILFIAHVLTALAVSATVLHHRREPTSMLAWVLAVTLIPFIGSATYLILGENRVVRRARRKRHRGDHLNSRLARELALDEEGLDTHVPEDLQVIERLGRELADMPATGGNTIEVHHGEEQIYPVLKRYMEEAQHHIHMEYYIWDQEGMGTPLRDLLIERARQGVECRVLLDSVGNFRQKKRFIQPMIDNGVQLRYFLPLYPLRRKRWSLHLRNHRKIAVFDGKRAVLGSHNIGGESLNGHKNPSPYYDVAISVVGPAVPFAQQVFAEDWLFAAGERIKTRDYFPKPPTVDGAALQIIPSGPDWEVRLPERILFEALTSANHIVRIVSPYFIPSSVVRMAMIQSSFRGVKMQLVVPGKCDVRLAQIASRSFYPELLDSGVEICEFRDGMIHSKIVTVDDRWYMLGSTNLDMRSFRLNFEITAVGYDEEITRQLAAIIDNYCDHADPVSHESIRSCSKRDRLIQGGARLVAPFL